LFLDQPPANLGNADDIPSKMTHVREYLIQEIALNDQIGGQNWRACRHDTVEQENNANAASTRLHEVQRMSVIQKVKYYVHKTLIADHHRRRTQFSSASSLDFSMALNLILLCSRRRQEIPRAMVAKRVSRVRPAHRVIHPSERGTPCGLV
jgi:hypothetical protein